MVLHVVEGRDALRHHPTVEFLNLRRAELRSEQGEHFKQWARLLGLFIIVVGILLFDVVCNNVAPLRITFVDL